MNEKTVGQMHQEPERAAVLIPRVPTMAWMVLLWFLLAAQSLGSAIVVNTVTPPFSNSPIVVPISLSKTASEDVAGVQMDIGFDGRMLRLKNISAGEAAVNAGKEVRFSTPGENRARIIVGGFNLNAIETGVIANLEFVWNADPARSDVPITIKNIVLSDPMGIAIAAEGVDGGLRAAAQTVHAKPEDASSLFGCFQEESPSEPYVFRGDVVPVLGFLAISLSLHFVASSRARS